MSLTNMQKYKTPGKRPTVEQLKEELLALKDFIKSKFRDLKDELAGLRADLREME